MTCFMSSGSSCMPTILHPPGGICYVREAIPPGGYRNEGEPTVTVTQDAQPTTHSHGKAVLQELSPLHRQLRRSIPDVYTGFGELHRAAFAEGELSTRTKEL